jgi:hypothetical protein
MFDLEFESIGARFEAFRQTLRYGHLQVTRVEKHATGKKDQITWLNADQLLVFCSASTNAHE